MKYIYIYIIISAAPIFQPPARAITESTGSPDSAPAEDPSESGLGAIDDLSLLDMEVEAVPLVLAATRRPQKADRLPYAVSVITQEDIRRSGARSIPDALRLAPGVDIAELSYGQYAVSLRGFSSQYSNKVLVLIDGRQIFDTIFGGTVWEGWPLQLENIARIEVIRGPAGITWGPNAVNGVINIITKDPGDQEGLTLTGMGGSRGTHKEYVGYGFKDEKLRLRVSSEYEQSEGFIDGGMFGGFRGGPDDRFGNLRSTVHAVYEQNERDTWTFSGGSLVGKDNVPATSLAFNLIPARWQSNYLMAKWNHEVEKDNRFEFTGYVNDYHSLAKVPWSDYRYQQYALQFNHVFALSEAHTLTWGIDTSMDITDGSNADPFILRKSVVRGGIVGLYLHDEWKLAPQWRLNFGGRVDYDSYGGFEPSGRISLSYDLDENNMVYAAISRAYAMQPSAKRFSDFPILSQYFRLVIPQDVEPDELYAYELGYHGTLFDKLDLSIVGFWHQYTHINKFSFGMGPPGLINTTMDKSHEIGLYGAEFEWRYPVCDRFTLHGNYTFQKLDQAADPDDLISALPPKHKFMIGGLYSPTDDLHLSSHLYFTDATFSQLTIPIEQRVSQYYRLDLRAEQEFWDDRGSVAIGVRNLLDKNHLEGTSTSLETAEVPRMVYAEIRMVFK